MTRINFYIFVAIILEVKMMGYLKKSVNNFFAVDFRLLIHLESPEYP